MTAWFRRKHKVINKAVSTVTRSLYKITWIDQVLQYNFYFFIKIKFQLFDRVIYHLYKFIQLGRMFDDFAISMKIFMIEI